MHEIQTTEFHGVKKQGFTELKSINNYTPCNS
jgi:hypothetical protein